MMVGEEKYFARLLSNSTILHSEKENGIVKI